MRIEIVAHKGKDVEYRKLDNEMDVVFIEWELRMKGYIVKVIKQ